MDQYIGEIRYFTYVRGAPEGWLLCDGSMQSISQYETLYALIGTTYGGDGSSTFGIPDLRGRVAIGAGGSNPLGQLTGSETVSLNGNQIPAHNHIVQASQNAGTTTDPTDQVFAAGQPIYTTLSSPSLTAMEGSAIAAAGQGQPHENCAPTQPLLACICTDGAWPQNPN